MQNVATGKSELAALPLTFSSDASAVIEDSSEFRSFLQDASDRNFTQPVEPKTPQNLGKTKSVETDTDQVDLQSSDEKTESETNPTIGIHATSESPEKQTESAKNQQSMQKINIELSEVQTEPQNISPLLAIVANKISNDDSNDDNKSDSDLAEEFASVIPSIDLLELLEQSQFKEITISQGEKAVNEGQFDDIHGVVEYLKNLSEQTKLSWEGDPPAILKEIDKFIAAFEAQTFESESPLNLAELVSKIQSAVELQSKAMSSPTNPSDEQLALDVELLSVVIAKDQVNIKIQDQVITENHDQAKTENHDQVNTENHDQVNTENHDQANTENHDQAYRKEANTKEANTKTHDLVEVLEADIQGELAGLLVKSANLPVEVDANEEQFVSALEDSESIKVADEIDNMLASAEPSDTMIAAKAADPKNLFNLSGQSKDIQLLLALSPEKLDKALHNLTDRLIHVDSTDNNNIEPQAKIVSTIKPDFIASLKTSIEEIKSQLKQGKAIDADLKTVVLDNLNRISQEINPESISATISRFNQTLELSSSLMALAHGPANSASGLETSNGMGVLDRVLAKENHTQSNLLQAKQTQQQAITFEKAVNIVRSEGHQQLVEKVRWMLNQNNLQADIRLDPPDLGAMKVRVSLSGETASVNIAVQSQQAKDLLDSAAPKLRELLQEQGIQLGQSSVEQEQRQKDHNPSGFVAGNSELADETELEQASQVTEQAIVNGRLSGIDYFV